MIRMKQKRDDRHNYISMRAKGRKVVRVIGTGMKAAVPQ
jgi:hypothetical protein